MIGKFSLSQFMNAFSDELSCLDEFIRLRYPKGIYCSACRSATVHYKLSGRIAYSCKYCRSQVYPLSGTIFEKSTTPLRIWFYAMFVMTHLRGKITAKQLQTELGVTYKTAWRMRDSIMKLMKMHNGNLLIAADEGEERIHKWTFFNKLELRVTQKKESSK